MPDKLVTDLAHVGIAVSDLGAVLRLLEEFGFELVHREPMNAAGATSYIVQSGSARLELLEPRTANGPVARYLERHGPGLHHLCLTVNNLPAAIQAAERANLQLVDPTPSHDSDGTRVFLHPRSAGGVLIGLVEPHAEQRQEGKRIINPGWSSYARKTFSPAVMKGNILFLSGLNAIDENGELIGTTIAEQAEAIYDKMDTLLQVAGASFQDVVKTTDYLVDRAGYGLTAEIRARFLGPDFPAATGVVVKELLGRGVLIEIDAIAVLG